MSRLTPTIRLTLGLLAIALSVLLVAAILGFDITGQQSVENRFQQLENKYLALVFIGAFLFVAYFTFLQRMLTTLDPRRAVPERVRVALNTLHEGVVIIDLDDRIMLSNISFNKLFNKSEQEDALLEQKLSDLGWHVGCNSQLKSLPWIETLREGTALRDVSISFTRSTGETLAFRVTASPLIADDGFRAGAMVTFIDVTDMERSQSDMRRMLVDMCVSRDEVKRQNQELQLLATRDVLTGCYNRRVFFEQLETHWKNSSRYHYDVSCIMVDLDHFKSINDMHGHAVGDEVLRNFGAALLRIARETDLVCRYGGEEFCILLPHTSLTQAVEAAARYQQAVTTTQTKGICITASFGVATKDKHLSDPQALINAADQCLYAAKHAGRNCTVSTDNLTAEQTVVFQHLEVVSPEDTLQLPFHAVTALFSALSYRDPTTAEHSRRVADLCVAAGEEFLSKRELYLLEIAALLHDIGKIGVPDAILLKPDALSPEERKIMQSHTRIGVEILHSAFSCERLTEIVRTHMLWFSGEADLQASVVVGEEIPLASRLLAIADAYDSMTNDSVYRKARSTEEAIEELRRCASRQFDPKLVQHFIETIQQRNVGLRLLQEQVSKPAALQIGLEIERLVHAVDIHDLHGVKTLAGRLRVTALKHGIQSIADLSAEVENAVHTNTELSEILVLIHDLLELCRSTQNVFLHTEAVQTILEPTR
jgi:diguanylate cyclase (GGDEF)-like protein/putative nucleotidyltransferase with HDIG domain